MPMYNHRLARDVSRYPYPVRIEYEDGQYSTFFYNGKMTIYVLKGNFGGSSVCLSQVDYCCGALFLSNLQSYHTGYGQKTIECAIIAAKLMGYSQLSCIIAGDPIKMCKKTKHIFEKFGFKRMGKRIKNKRTNNYLYNYVLEIK